MTSVKMTTLEESQQSLSQSFSAPSGDLWVFGYGSLMWRPDFPFTERRIARVRGYSRSFCILSHVHRGTADKPGLVLGLDRGGSCVGVVFRVAVEHSAATVEYLRKREQVTGVYLERTVMAETGSKERVPALTYVVDRSHSQYSGQLSDDEKLSLIRQGEGISGRNPDYVRSTHEHLTALGIRDKAVARLANNLIFE